MNDVMLTYPLAIDGTRYVKILREIKEIYVNNTARYGKQTFCKRKCRFSFKKKDIIIAIVIACHGVVIETCDSYYVAWDDNFQRLRPCIMNWLFSNKPFTVGYSVYQTLDYEKQIYHINQLC